jgi:hypothetical protein
MGVVAGVGGRGDFTSLLWARELRGGRRILLVEDFSVTHMTWNSVGDHYHPTDVAYVKPDGSGRYSNQLTALRRLLVTSVDQLERDRTLPTNGEPHGFTRETWARSVR